MGETIKTDVKRVLMKLMPLAVAQIIGPCDNSFEYALVDDPEQPNSVLCAGLKYEYNR